MSEEILAEMTATDAEGDGGLPYVPPLASDATPGLIHAVRPSYCYSWSVNSGAVEIGYANQSVPGLFGGISDHDAIFYPDGMNNGRVQLPVYAKSVQDINGDVWPLSELEDDSWQAATVAACVLPDGTPLYLRLRTACHGHALIFELSTSNYYSS